MALSSSKADTCPGAGALARESNLEPASESASDLHLAQESSLNEAPSDAPEHRSRALLQEPGRPGFKPERLRETHNSDGAVQANDRGSESVHDSGPQSRGAHATLNAMPHINGATIDNQAASIENMETAADATEAGTGETENTGNTISANGSTERSRTTASHGTESHAESNETASTANQSDIAEHNTSQSLFDQLLDSVMDIPHSRDANTASDGSEYRPSTSSETDLGPASITSAGSAADSSSAIVITVNYMFMDVANDPNPGRTGSLVVTLPNNAANREPRIILQFISLATRMAYSALVNSPKRKPGISVEKFESFSRLNPEDASSETCSICYEPYENLGDAVVTKRRKLSPEVHTPTETTSSERSEEPEINPEIVSGAERTSQHEHEHKPFLCDHREEYDHSALELPCSHVFGRSCIAHWLKENANCPLCRLSVGDVESNTATTHAPISYIRFGGLDDDASSNNAETGPDSDGISTERVQNTLGSESRRPGFLRRATLVIFNAAGRADNPPAPTDAENAQRDTASRTNNSRIRPMTRNFQNFLRRSRRLRESDLTGASSLFTSGVASRRTPNGVRTHASDSSSLGDFFDSLRFLYADSRADREDRDETREEHEASGES